MKPKNRIDSFAYFDGLVKNASLWADRLNYNGNTEYTKTAELYCPEELKVSEKFEFHTVAAWKTEKGEEHCKYSVVHQDWRRFYSENMRASVHEFEKPQDMGGIRLTSERDNTGIKIEVSDEGILWFPAAFINAERAGKAYFAEFKEPARKFIRLVYEPENPENEPGFYPHEILKAEVLSHESPNTEPPLFATEDMGIKSPVLFPEPFTDENREELIPLSGMWKMSDYPTADYWRADTDISEYRDMPVPADADHFGSDIAKRAEKSEKNGGAGAYAVYTQRINIPENMRGKEIMLRFESVVSYARVFVNGCFVTSHRGALTPFDCDITKFVKPGLDAVITVSAMIENLKPDFLMTRGICSYVWLFALPKTALTVLRTVTDLENENKTGLLTVREKIHCFGKHETAETRYTLISPDNAHTVLETEEISRTADGCTVKKFRIDKPALWSAETPRLYTLKTELFINGNAVFTNYSKVGFNSIKIKGNRLLVNGNEEKLHGVNWMCHSPYNGLAGNYEHDRESLIKFKAANVNFIRTCHNPQKRYVHELCDELGIYVEEEAATVFLSRWVPNIYERYDYLVNPKYRPVFIDGYAQMMANVCSHASLLYYSLGNESDWSVNTEAARDYLRAADKKHPHKFSWGYSHPQGAVEIQSEHYTNPMWMGGNSEYPVIYDEHAHTIGENLAKIESDPSHRDMYAFRLKEVWETAYNKPGGLGVAVWNGREFAGIKNGEHNALFRPKWGELDLWDRAKPEFWHIRKIFSPIHIDESVIYRIPPHGNLLQIPVQNRYSQLDFGKIEMQCLINGEEYPAKLPPLQPGEQGYISLRKPEWFSGDEVFLSFMRTDDPIGNTLIDSFKIILERPAKELPFKQAAGGGDVTFFETQVESQINSDCIHFWFGRSDGMIHGGKFKNKLFVKEGPYLNLGTNYPLTPESADFITAEQNGEVKIISRHRYKELENPVEITQFYRRNGEIEISFGFDFPAEHSIDEAGITLRLKDVTRQIWERNSKIFTDYPDDCVGRLSGDIKIRRGYGTETKTEKPCWQWNEDEFEFQLTESPDFSSTRDFRAAKRDYYYVAALREDGLGLAAVSNGNGGSVRFEVSCGDVLMHINSECGSVTLGEFGANRFELPQNSGRYSAKINLRFFDLNE